MHLSVVGTQCSHVYTHKAKPALRCTVYFIYLTVSRPSLVRWMVDLLFKPPMAVKKQHFSQREKIVLGDCTSHFHYNFY